MPTDVKIQLTIPGVTAKDYYRVILEDESLIKRFHADVNNDPNATVSPWEGDHRTVAFHMTLNVPGMIKKMIGTDHIRIQEVTKITWKGSSCFELATEPCLDFPGANKFTTSGTTVVSDAPAGCQIDCTLRCTAALPWPMQGSVEAVMANEGKQTVTKYLEYTKQACEEDKNNRAAAPAPAPTAATAAAEAARSQPPPMEKASAAAGVGAATDTMDEEEWHDFEDEGDMDGPGAVPSRSAAAAGPLASYEPVGRDEVAVRCLLQIQRSGVESVALLRQVLAALRDMDANIADIHEAAVQTRPGAGAKPGTRAAAAAGRKPAPSQAEAPPPATAANGTARPTPAATSASAGSSCAATPSASYASFTYGLLLGLAAASAGAALYIRVKQRSTASS